MKLKSKLFLCLIVMSANFLAYSQPTQTPINQPNQRIWKINEVIDEPRAKPAKKVRYCDGGRFAPCVCWRQVSRNMRYRPALKECDGNAAIILDGKYESIFSVVVRDSENRDRWPLAGFNGCSAELASSEDPPLYCSAFKTQKKFNYESLDGKSAKVYCLGASGYSKLFKKVTRVTVKLADVPGSTTDPLVRWCLRSPTKKLN